MPRMSPPHADPDTLHAIEQAQLRAVGYLLIRCGQLWNQMAITRVNAAGDGVTLRQAHTRLFPYLTNRDGIRITELARRLDVSKQAIQPLIAELQAAGVVSVKVDPSDARALRVHLTEAGAAAFAAGNGILNAIENELEQVMGNRLMERLRRDLKSLLKVLNQQIGQTPVTVTPGRFTAHVSPAKDTTAAHVRHRRRK